MMRLLLEHGANPDIGIKEAAAYSQMDMVELMLGSGADPTHALPDAARHGNADMVKLLLAHGADPASGIEEAVRGGRADIVALLRETGAPLHREKLLPLAVQGGNLFIVKTLLEHGAVPGGYELRCAAQYGHADILKLLLPLTRSGINAANWQGWTPLRLALKRGDSECVRLLLEYGADADETDSRGRTLLDYALQLGHEECAGLLRSTGGKHGK